MSILKLQCSAHLFGIALLLALAGSLTVRLGHAATVEPAIRVGSEVEFPPFAFVDEHGQAAGFSVDLIKAVADAMDLPLTITTGSWDAMWNGLVEGQFDVLPVVATSPERQQVVDFSLPHTETFDAFFVRNGTLAIRDLAAAQGKNIVVMRSDAAHHALLERNFQGKLVLVDTIPAGLKLVASGQHDALLCSKLIGVLAIKQHGIRGLTAGPLIPDYTRVFAFGVKKDADELREKLNQGLLIVKTNGVYDRMYEKWLSYDDPWRKYRQALVIALLAATALILTAVVWLVMLRRQVNRRTAELAARNAALEQEIAARTRVEEELRNHRENLERLIEERTSALRESETTLRAILDATKESIWLFRDDGVILMGNETAIQRMRRPANEVIGKQFKDIVPAHVAESRQTRLRQVIESGLGLEFEDERGGIQFHHSFYPVTDRAGRITRVACFSRDITARKQAEQELKETKEHFELVFNTNPDAAQITRLTDGCVVNINDGVTAMTGFTREDIIGKRTLDLDIDLWEHPDDRQHIIDELRRTGFCGNYETMFKRKDGSRFVGMISARLYCNRSRDEAQKDTLS